MRLVLDTAEVVREYDNPELAVTGVVLNRVGRYREDRARAGELAGAWPGECGSPTCPSGRWCTGSASNRETL